ncbi:hypothetical protein DFH28DRAFT_267994 [Melampsora americana]|nr:hypothetical protein DFH28DRAFT_267994 [Melampsora americana]
MFSNLIHFRISSTVLFFLLSLSDQNRLKEVKLSIPIVNSLNLYTLNVGIGYTSNAPPLRDRNWFSKHLHSILIPSNPLIPLLTFKNPFSFLTFMEMSLAPCSPKL